MSLVSRRDSSGKTQLTNLGSIKRQSRTASIVNGIGLTTLGQSTITVQEANGHSYAHYNGHGVTGNGSHVNGSERPNRVSVTSNGRNGVTTTTSLSNGISTNNNNNKSIII